MDTERAESLFTQLWDHLKAQNMRSLDIQTRNAEEAVRSLEAASSEEEKEEIIRDYYRILYTNLRILVLLHLHQLECLTLYLVLRPIEVLSFPVAE